MRVLVLDQNLLPRFWGAQDIRNSLFEAARADSLNLTVTTIRPPALDLPLDLAHNDSSRVLGAGSEPFHGLVLSGSLQSCLERPEWVKRLEKFLEHWLASERPVFGICYGAQILAKLLGGQLGESAVPEYGPTALKRIPVSGFESRLLHGISPAFSASSSHKQEVTALAQGFVPTAHSEHCGIQAFEHPVRNVFAVQFHPERSGDEVRLPIFRNFLATVKP